MRNLYISLLFGLIALGQIFTSCDMRNYDVPELEVPEYVNKKGLEFITIAQVKAMDPAFNTATYDTYHLIQGSNKALRARVSGNDESGNIYKTLYLQDETGAIVLGTQLTGLFPLFRIGQEVIVELDSLAVGRYAGSYQIGGAKPSIYLSSTGPVNQMDRMSSSEFDSHVFRNGTPDPNLIVPVVYTSLPDVTENIRGTLVKLDSVTFDEGGRRIFATKGSSYGSTNLDIVGTKVIVRTSEYANFAADTIPSGKGSLICILTRYQRGRTDAVQLVIRSRKDLIFNKK